MHARVVYTTEDMEAARAAASRAGYDNGYRVGLQRGAWLRFLRDTAILCAGVMAGSIFTICLFILTGAPTP